MNLFEAKQLLKKRGYRLIREGRKLNEHTINKDEVYGVDVYYNSDFSFPDFDTQEPESTEEYTYDELVSEFGKNAAHELITLGSYDTGNNTYYKLAYVIGADGDVITADKLDF